MDKRKLAVLGAASGAVILGGAIISVLRIVLNDLNGKKLFIITVFTTETEAFIVICLVFIIGTGIVGLVAAFAQKKWMYLTTWISAGFSIFITIYCIVKHDKAIDEIILAQYLFCRSRRYFTASGENSVLAVCDHEGKLSDPMIAILTFFILTLLAEAAELVVACYYFFPSMPNPGVVIIKPGSLGPEPNMTPQADAEAGPITIPQDGSKPDLS